MKNAQTFHLSWFVSPHGPRPGRQATRELKGVWPFFFSEAEKVSPLTSEGGGVGPGEVSWERWRINLGLVPFSPPVSQPS